MMLMSVSFVDFTDQVYFLNVGWELAFLGLLSFIYLLYNFHMFLLLPLLFPLLSVNLCFFD